MQAWIPCKGAGLSARPGGHSRISRGLGTVFPRPARDDHHRDRDTGFHHAGVAHRINTIALAKSGKTAKQVVAPIPPLFQGASTAIRAGDLLFISGLMAVRDGSLIAEAKADPTQPFYAVPVKSELREILRQAEAICQAAGTTLKNAVRIQQFHADLADLPATLEVWSEATDGMPLPLSPVEVPWLPVPDARLQLDLWVYIPD